MFPRIIHVSVSPVVCVTIANHKKPQVKKYYFKKKTSSSHSRNGKDDVNHDSTIQPRSPLSRQSLTFDAIPTYHAGEHGHIRCNTVTLLLFMPRPPEYLTLV